MQTLNQSPRSLPGKFINGKTLLVFFIFWSFFLLVETWNAQHSFCPLIDWSRNGASACASLPPPPACPSHFPTRSILTGLAALLLGVVTGNPFVAIGGGAGVWYFLKSLFTTASCS